MPLQNHPDIWSLIAALVISLVSGFVSIARRILMGHPSSFLWIISEFAAAILCGYLMFHSYPFLESILLKIYVTQPVAIAIAAHTGGKLLQEAEKTIIAKYRNLFRDDYR